MKLYRFRVSIFGMTGVYRIIEASENCTFDDLHDAIFEAFERYDPHMYSFFLTRRDARSMRPILQAPVITHPVNVEGEREFGNAVEPSDETTIADAGLHEKEVIHYWFDFGDDWWHRIRVDKIADAPSRSKAKHLEIVKVVGESPPQYPEYEDEDFDGETDS
jgi:hypothetical protein